MKKQLFVLAKSEWLQTVLMVLFAFYCGSAQEALNLSLVSNVPQEVLCNDIWGYVDEQGTEYAILGTRSDARIYSLEDPTTPRLVSTVPGTQSVWRDFKSFGPYVYGIADQGNDGLTIIDMQNAPDSIAHIQWRPVLLEQDTLRRCHNLYIDEKGLLYLAGCNLGNGGVIILDLNNSPLEPVFLGVEDERYAHDVFARGDFLFTSEIFEGNLAIYDISDPDSVLLVSRIQTSTFFTHNAWPSDDGHYIFTTDERGNSFVDAYDISDPFNPVFLDKYQPVAGQGIIPHNTHFIDDYLVTSWYTEGVLIIDVSDPSNMVRVGQFDTNPQDNNGCWGAYPYLPSGLILASDMDNGLFVLQPHYRRAGRLNGKVTDVETQSAISQVTVNIAGEYGVPEVTGPDGTYATGTAQEDSVTISFTHPAYATGQRTVAISPGSHLEVNMELRRLKEVQLSGMVKDHEGEAVSGAKISIANKELSWELESDESGSFEISVLEGEYDISIGKWGFKTWFEQMNTADKQFIQSVLDEGYQDDFNLDLGWTVSGDAISGQWERSIPNGTSFQGLLSNPSLDVDDDIGSHAYVTGNDGRSVGTDDVDDGSTLLQSPPFFIKDFVDPVLSYRLWFFNGGGNSPPNDEISVALIFETHEIPLETVRGTLGESGSWRDSTSYHLKTIVDTALWDEPASLLITIADDMANGHLVEGGFDRFRISDRLLTTSISEENLSQLKVFPNPGSGFFVLRENNQPLFPDKVEIYDPSGRLLVEDVSGGSSIDISYLHAGTYFLRIRYDGFTHLVKVIKQ